MSQSERMRYVFPLVCGVVLCAFLFYEYTKTPSWGIIHPEIGSDATEVTSWCTSNKLSFAAMQFSDDNPAHIQGSSSMIYAKGVYVNVFLSHTTIDYLFYFDQHDKVIDVKKTSFDDL